MPTDSNGVHSLPAGYLATTGQTIQASQHNPPLEDLSTAVTARLPRNGAAPMTGALGIVDGAVGAPAIKFNNASTTGIYKTTTGFGATVSGSLVAEFNSSGLVLSKTATLKDGGDTASAAALTLGDGNIFNITGTTAITSIGTKGVGAVVLLRFAGALTLTHHSTDLILTTGTNITTASGDWAMFEEYASGDWRMVFFHRASGQAIVATLPPGYKDGCTLSNRGSNSIDIADGFCRDSTNAVNITVAAMADKQLDSNWAPGAGAGLRNSAAGITNTTYHIYAVAKANGTQDVYAHTSATVATALAALRAETGGADYIYARRIGSILRESGAIAGFRQKKSLFIRNVPAKDGNSIGPDATERTLTLPSVPSGIEVEAIINGWWAAVDGLVLDLHPLGLTTSITSSSGPGSSGNAISGSGVGSTGRAIPTQRVLTNTSQQIGYKASGSGTAQVWTLGWVDFFD